MQRVIRGKCSDWVLVKLGVPQGTILGLILFIICINDISTDLKSTDKIYADDTKIYRTISSPDVDIPALQCDLDRLGIWANKWQMHKKIIATISYQAFYNRALAGINSLFTKQCPLRNLRDGLKLYVQRPRSDFLRSSFSHRTSLLWNNLPMYLKSKPNVVSFKSALKAKSDILDKITFDGLQGINKDIVNYIY